MKRVPQLLHWLKYSAERQYGVELGWIKLKEKKKEDENEGQNLHILSISQNKYCKKTSLLLSLTPLCQDRHFNRASFPLSSPYNTPNHPLTHLQLHPTHAVPPHPVSKLGHASQPAAHTFLSSSSFWTLIHLWSDSVHSLQGIQDYCTYWAVASTGGFGYGGCEEMGGEGEVWSVERVVERVEGSLSEGWKDKWRMGGQGRSGFQKNGRKMIREKNRDCLWPIQEHFICSREYWKCVWLYSI